MTPKETVAVIVAISSLSLFVIYATNAFLVIMAILIICGIALGIVWAWCVVIHILLRKYCPGLLDNVNDFWNDL